MPYFQSPGLFIDMARLPPPKVIETIEYEVLLQAYKARILAQNSSLAAALNLEQSPLNIILQTEAYGEYIVRQRINAAARAVMLPFATGTDLDVLGALYNVARLPLVSNPRSYLTNPEDWQGDEAFRSQIQLAPEAFSTAGSAGAYIWHAKDADSTIHDAEALRIDDNGGVRVVIMSSGDDPKPTQLQIDNVVKRLGQKNIKPLTAVVSVGPVDVSYIDIVAQVSLYPGPDQAVVMASIGSALQAIKTRIHQIGRDLTMAAIYGALTQEGVQNASIMSPASDVVVGNTGCVAIKSISVSVNPDRME